MNISELKRIIRKRGFTVLRISEELGISKTTFYHKLRTNTFGVLEAEAMIRLLEIEDPVRIFFDD